MQYLGGKSRQGKQIAEYMSRYRKPGALFVDVFCGALNVSRHMANPRVAIDLCEPLVNMWKAALAGWVPPTKVSEEQYHWYKKYGRADDPMTAFVGFGCSFGGRWFSGYARGREGNYASQACNSILKKVKDCNGLAVIHNRYQNVTAPPGGTIFYLDPPYSKSTEYKGVEAFNSPSFWGWAEAQAMLGTTVFVSEINAPPSFVIAIEIEGGGHLNAKGGNFTDRLYVHRSSPMARDLATL